MAVPAQAHTYTYTRTHSLSQTGDNRQCKHAALCVPMPQDMKPFNQPDPE